MPYLCQQHCPKAAQKVQLTYKLFLLENARCSLEQELRNFTNQAYKEVQDALSSSFSAVVFGEVLKALESKCQSIMGLLESFKNLSVAPHAPTGENGMKAYYPQPLGSERSKNNTMQLVPKLSPLSENSLMTGSISKAVQGLITSLSRHCLKLFLKLQPALDSDNDSSVTPTPSGTSLFRKEVQVLLEAESKPEYVYIPHDVAQTSVDDEEKLEILLPPLENVLEENHSLKPPVMWGSDSEVHLQHQKQTSNQLLSFIKAKTKNKEVCDITISEQTQDEYDANGSENPHQDNMETQNRQLECDPVDKPLDNQNSSSSPKVKNENVEEPTPVFSIKKVVGNRTLVYRCVVATETELWDIGDIFMETLNNNLEQTSSHDLINQKTNSSVDANCVKTEQNNSGNDSQCSAPNNVNIPDFEIRRFEEPEVMVSHVVSPSEFYIQETHCSEKLEGLLTDSCKTSPSYAKQNCIPDIGMAVLGRSNTKEKWFRAMVTKICGVSRDDISSKSSIKVDVKRLDYGDTACLPLWDIRPLPPEMTVLPLQSLQVSLAHVMPVNGTAWSEEAVGWFKAMTNNRTFYARLYPQGPAVTVELFLEKGKLGAMRRGAPLSVRLAQNGHAKHSKLKSSDLIKKRAFEVKARKQHSDWEKYLISCYTQTEKK